MTYLRWLPVNQAWVFFFGEVIIAMGTQRFFFEKEDAVKAANDCGLDVSVTGKVSARK